MKRRRCWARTLGCAIPLFYSLFLVLFPSAEVARTQGSTTTRGSHRSDTTDGRFRSSLYYHHIKFTNHQNHHVNNSTSSLQQNNHHDDQNVRISFVLHDPHAFPLENRFNLYVTCPVGSITTNKKKRIPTGLYRSKILPPLLKRVVDQQDRYGQNRSGRVLDFTATLSTNLKLLFIGDSVMVQLAQAFDEMVTVDKIQDQETTTTTTTRKVLWESWHGHDGGTIVAPTRGGGVSALWRMTGLLSRSNKGKPPPNSAGGGWSDTEIHLLTNYSYDPKNRMTTKDPRNSTATTVSRFDVVILRVMHGWMRLHEITHARLVEAVELSHTLFRATTVIIMTVPFTNNVKTIEDMNKVNEINEDIRQIAREWHLMREKNIEGLQHILVVEYGTYYNHIIWSNGLHLGYNVTSPLRATQYDFDMEGPDMLLDRLRNAGEWPPSIPMICNDTSLLGPDRQNCHRNYLFLDGMHVCPETLASRFAAGIACLIGCVYNKSTNHGASEHNEEKSRSSADHDVRACEQECNEQFLSVMPVEESWMETTVASFAV